MKRLVICRMLDDEDVENYTGSKDSTLFWKKCDMQLQAAREKSCEIAHIYRPGRTTKLAPKFCRPLSNEAIYEADIESIFSHQPLEMFCTDGLTDVIYLAGTIELQTLTKSLKEASYLGVTIATLSSVSIVAPRASSKAFCLRDTINLANLCIQLMRESLKMSKVHPFATLEENEDFSKSLEIAQVSMLRWRTNLALKAGILKPPGIDDDC